LALVVVERQKKEDLADSLLPYHSPKVHEGVLHRGLSDNERVEERTAIDLIGMNEVATFGVRALKHDASIVSAFDTHIATLVGMLVRSVMSERNVVDLIFDDLKASLYSTDDSRLEDLLASRAKDLLAQIDVVVIYKKMMK
jgi:hypothetical protein